MIADALKFLTDLGNTAAGFKKIDLPDGDVLIAHPDGTFETYDARLPYRNDTLSTLDSLIAWIGADRGEVEVFIASDAVSAIAYRTSAARADAARFPLNRSRAWQYMQAWIETPKPQAEVVRMLRGPLRGCCSDGLLGVFRSLEFRSGATSERTIKGPSSDSLGRSAHRQALSNGQDLPDELTFTLPVYDIHSIPDATIPVAIDVDYDAERIRLIEVGDAKHHAEEAAARWIASQLTDQTKARVFHGTYGQA